MVNRNKATRPYLSLQQYGRRTRSASASDFPRARSSEFAVGQGASSAGRRAGRVRPRADLCRALLFHTAGRRGCGRRGAWGDRNAMPATCRFENRKRLRGAQDQHLPLRGSGAARLAAGFRRTSQRNLHTHLAAMREGAVASDEDRHRRRGLRSQHRPLIISLAIYILTIEDRIG